MSIRQANWLAITALLTTACVINMATAQDTPERVVNGYRYIYKIPYCTVDGKTQTLNAFLPVKTDVPAPAMVDIHGGWFYGGDAANDPADFLTSRGVAMFSITYRLGDQGGFPQNIRDCRNAIRFIRKNAAKFNIDPNRIACMGGSAGGHLSLMVAMAPERFDDGGPTPELKGVSARVCGSFSWIPPTDFVRFWNEAPSDIVAGADGKTTFRGPDDSIPNDARPRLRVLFHGVTPDTKEHIALYTRMCPIGNVRKSVPPVLICDGELDPIVPGTMGKELDAKLRAAGSPSTYWMTPKGGHGFPGGPGFDAVLDTFLKRIFKLEAHH